MASTTIRRALHLPWKAVTIDYAVFGEMSPTGMPTISFSQPMTIVEDFGVLPKISNTGHIEPLTSGYSDSGHPIGSSSRA